MIYRVSPCISPRATARQKHVRGCKNHQKRRRQRRPRRGFDLGGGGERKWGKGQLSCAIWEVLHIYGLLVPARKQISGKSRSEITLESSGRKAAPFSSGRISAFATGILFSGEMARVSLASAVTRRFLNCVSRSARWISRQAYCELNVKYLSWRLQLDHLYRDCRIEWLKQNEIK